MVTIAIEGSSTLMWWFGILTIIFGILFSLGAIVHWVRVDKKGRLYEVMSWPDKSVHNLLLTYFHFICSFAISVLCSMCVFSGTGNVEKLKRHPYYAVGGTIAAMTVLTTVLEFTPYDRKNRLLKTSAWVLHSGIIAIPMTFFGTYICVISLLYTVFLLLLATVISYTANSKTIQDNQDELLKAYYIVFSCSAACIITNNFDCFMDTSLLCVSIYGGIILYTAVFIVNTNYVINEVLKDEVYDPLYMSAVMYLCSVNLFIRIALYKLVKNMLYHEE